MHETRGRELARRLACLCPQHAELGCTWTRLPVSPTCSHSPRSPSVATCKKKHVIWMHEDSLSPVRTMLPLKTHLPPHPTGEMTQVAQENGLGSWDARRLQLQGDLRTHMLCKHCSQDYMCPGWGVATTLRTSKPCRTARNSFALSLVPLRATLLQSTTLRI